MKPYLLVCYPEDQHRHEHGQFCNYYHECERDHVMLDYERMEFN
jgi:hypothetical protein